MYYIGPNRRQRWRDMTPGAMLSTSLWLLATMGFGWYVRNLADYRMMYGSIGVAIALLVWLYVLAVIALFGCEYNAELERWRGVKHRVKAAG
jgi:membrane protein